MCLAAGIIELLAAVVCETRAFTVTEEEVDPHHPHPHPPPSELSECTGQTARALVKRVVNQSNDDGWTPLHAACAGGHVVCVRSLLALGASVRFI